MKGDFSRDRFAAQNHYGGVLLEQGGLLTDADWHEHTDIVRHRIEREARDVVGLCGGPLGSAAFAIAPGSEPRAIAVGAGSPLNLWVAGDSGYVFRSSDGGATWSAVDTGTERDLCAVRFDGAHGWAVGDAGTVRHSADLGASWSPQSGGVLSTFRAVAVFGPSNAWVAGDGGIVLVTTDAGVSWTRVRAGHAQLNGIALQSATRGIVVGNGGAILTTTDGGATWEARVSPVTAHLRAVTCVGGNAAWAVGDDGTILRSADGGITWTLQASGTTSRLTSVWFDTATSGVAAGAAGTARRTTDAGVTWTGVVSGTADDVRGVVVAGDDVWTIAAGASVRHVSLSAGTGTDIPLPHVGFSIGAGRYYVRGTLCEVDAPSPYYSQPDRGTVPRLTPGQHLVYVEAWMRLLTALEEPSIREVALGDADPSTRAKTVWQVRTVPLPVTSPPAWTCTSSVPELDARRWPPRAALMARSEPQLQATSLCDIGATAGYRRLENQLYRVEIQRGGANPAFKWSRENGSVAFAIDSIETPSSGSPVETVVVLRSRGKDEHLELSPGEWVEIANDDLVLEERVGPLFQFLRDGSDRMEIVLSGAVPASLASDPSRHPVLRRWDHRTAQDAVALVESTWLELEDGVQISFDRGGEYRPGDYWLIPARTATGDVEWPRDASDAPLPQPPSGVESRICRLAVITVGGDGTVSVNSDCRHLFPPLTELDQLLYVSGDGQEGLPGQVLPQRLTVRVARGTHAAAGVTVRFEIASGAGALVGATTGTLLDVVTVADGVASCQWRLDGALAVASRHQTVTAHLVDASGGVLAGTGVVFSAVASFSLVPVGGDGQQSAPGGVLPQPLEVRVANDQVPFEGVQVQFSVTDGGGAITGVNPVPTSAQGIASAVWQLGGGGTQRVEAQLIDGSGSVVQRVAFNANIEATSSGGCAVTVGDGGQVPQLDATTLKQLLEEHRGHLCLCFLAGDHKVDGLAVGAGPDFHLSIHGCGRPARIHVQESWRLEGFESVEISNVSFQIEGQASLGFTKCEEVTLSGLSVVGTAARQVPIFFFEGVVHPKLVDTRISLREKGLSVMFRDGDAAVEICQCDIQGLVVFYGPPATPKLPQPPLPSGMTKPQLNAALKSGAIRLVPGRGRLRLVSNRLDALAISREMAARLSQANVGDIGGVFRDAVIVGNSFDESASQFVAERLVLSSNTFMGKPVPQDGLGVFVAAGAAAAGNVSADRSDPATVFIPNAAGLDRAANFVTIVP